MSGATLSLTKETQITQQDLRALPRPVREICNALRTTDVDGDVTATRAKAAVAAAQIELDRWLASRQLLRLSREQRFARAAPVALRPAVAAELKQ